MKSQIRHHAQEILRLLDEEKPIEEPEQPRPDSELTIERHPNSEPLHNATFVSGTPINFLMNVKENGKIKEGVKVTWVTPAGKVEVITDINGNAGIHRVELPSRGMKLRAYISTQPDIEAYFIVHSTKHRYNESEQPEDGGEIPPVEEPETEHPDYRFDADGHKIHPLGYVPAKPVYNVKDVSVPRGNISVGVVFLGKNFELPQRTRVMINNHEYDFRGRNDFDFRVSSRAGGFIVNLPEKMVRVAVHPLDIWNKDFGNHGYMNFSWKLLAKNNQYDFRNIVTNDKDHPNFWAGQKYGGRMMLRHGWNAVWEPNPRFWEFNLTEHGYLNRYNQTSKFLIIVGNPRDWEEMNNRTEWHPIP